jgi:hypothetical protein
MAASTITINGSTVAAPTSVNKFPVGRTNVLVPIDGDVITQRSNNRDNQGDKNLTRGMTWNALPDDATNYSWTHTVTALKALEGTEVALNTGSKFGYGGTDVNIMVVNVDATWIAAADGVNWYQVTLSYTHH